MLSRKINPLTEKLISNQYDKLINTGNILKISSFKINKIFSNEEEKIRDAFLHNLLSKWIDEQHNKNDQFFSILKKLIRKTRISLSTEEKHDLFLLEERIFSKERHIKIIEVNYKLTSREKVGVKFTNAQLFKKIIDKKIERLEIIKKGDLLVSNKRIIFPNGDISFRFSKIDEYSYEFYGFEFKIKREIFVIRIHDQETLNNTMKNLISKKVKNAIKKCKNN